MSLSQTWFLDRLKKRANKGARGYPVGSVVFYGPADKLASKVGVGITAAERAEIKSLERRYSPDQDARKNSEILKTVLHYLQAHGVKSVVMSDRLPGCPHEEGQDYPEGEQCPHCPYWRNRDRFTGLPGGEAGEA